MLPFPGLLQVFPSRDRRAFFVLDTRLIVAAALLLGVGPAVAQTAGGQPSVAALRAACSDDAKRLCSNVQTGGGRVVACLKQNQDQLSDRCRQAAGLPPKAAATPDAQPGAPASPSTTPAATESDTFGAAAGAPGPAGAGAAPAPAAVPDAKPTMVAGETFVRKVIADPAHNNTTVATIHVPEKWKLDSKVVWHYDHVENPVVFSAMASNPANAEAFIVYPPAMHSWMDVAPQYRRYMPGKQSQAGSRDGNGNSSEPIQAPMQALAAFIKQARPNAQNLKFVGQQELPGLGKALKLDPLPGDRGVAIKVSYDMNGQTVDEAFFGVYTSSTGSSPAKTVGSLTLPAGTIKQTVWGLRVLQSFRAPTGTLEKRMPMFCLIAKSMTYNPEWLAMLKTVHDQMMAEANQKIQQGYNQIQNGQAAMQQMQAQEKALDAAVAKEDAVLRSPGYDDNWLRTSGGGSGGGGKLSSTDHFDNNIRGEDTVNDPSTGGLTQVSNAGDYHFTDGYGNYRTSDDPNYTPEKNGESGSWTPMTIAQ